jgi:hypothetical protein
MTEGVLQASGAPRLPRPATPRLARRFGRTLVGGCMVMASLAALTLMGGAAQAATPSYVAWQQANGSANGCTTTCPASPAPRAADPVVYDGATNQVILFGGLGTGFISLNDTWSWNGTAWTQVADSGDAGCTTTCTASPPVRAASSMAYDPASKQLIVFGGDPSGGPFLNDTWDWNGSTWTQVADSGDAGCTSACTASPPGRSGGAMAYDPAIGKIVLFGGLDPSNDTWTWDGTTWTQVSDSGDAGCTNTCTDSPPTTVSGSMAFDVPANQLILFGGGGYNSNATWSFDGTTWTQLDDGTDAGCTDACTSSPPPRSGAGMEYDPAQQQLVLFAGLDGSTNLNDTWTWDGTAWTQVDDDSDAGCTDTCAGSPPARSAIFLTYDETNRQTVLFGGQGTPAYSAPVLDDTWTSLQAPAPVSTGYWLVASDGGVFSYGAPFEGSHGSSSLNAPIVGMASTPDGMGYWLVASDGGVFTYGDAVFYGSHGGSPLNKPIVGMAATTDGKGYWLVASDGGVFAYGDAVFQGSHGGSPLNKPIVGMASNPSGSGYWLVASDGGVFSYGQAAFYGSHGGMPLNQPVVGIAANATGPGYWLVASDGGVFAYGAPFLGSHGGSPLNQPIVGLAATADGNGYMMDASDGGVFAYGDAVFQGSHGGSPLNKPIVGMAAAGIPQPG